MEETIFHPCDWINRLFGKDNNERNDGDNYRPEEKHSKDRRKFKQSDRIAADDISPYREHELMILEMGTNTRGEIKRLTQIAMPDMGLITNIGPAHLAGFGSMDVVREEKNDLFLNMPSSGIAIINLDDEAVATAAEKWQWPKITFSMSPNADVTVKDIEKNGAKGVRFNLVIGGTCKKIEMKIAGLHHVYNAMAAAAAAFAVGIDIKTISEGLAGIPAV